MLLCINLNTNVLLVPPRSKKSLCFNHNLNFTTRNLKILAKMWIVDARCYQFYHELFLFCYSDLKIIRHCSLRFFMINLSVVAHLYIVKYLIVLIPWVKAWDTRFVCIAINLWQSITGWNLHKTNRIIWPRQPYYELAYLGIATHSFNLISVVFSPLHDKHFET